MARIEDVVKVSLRLTPLQEAVLMALELRPREVFAYGEQELLDAVGRGSPSSIDWTLWYLSKHGLIDKQKAGRRVYFGSNEAVAQLRKQLESQKRKASRAPTEPASSSAPLEHRPMRQRSPKPRRNRKPGHD